MTTKFGVDFLKAVAGYMSQNGSHDSIIKCFRITGGGNGRCIGEFTVTKDHLNTHGGLHGGFIATLVDNVTTYALMSKESHPGVSANLHVNYFQSVKEGDEIILDANTLKAGKTLAYVDCVLTRKFDGTVIAQGGQSKFVKITGGGDGKCTAEFTVAVEHLNRAGGLHGGFTATLVDMVTTYALMSKPCHPGVSVNINVNYLKPAREGDDVIIDASLLRAGKKLAFLECELRHKKDNSLIAKGGHTKFVDFQ
uniref:Thioesterase domain-containing protein n=1 Tax=Glossina pallidipes TaxID=7398 RepID=A0A1B0AI39_GLOPL